MRDVGRERAIPARSLLALAILTLMWGVNWPIMKLALRELPPLHFRAITMTGGVLLLIAWYRGRGVSLRLPQGSLGRVALLALPNILGWHALSIFGVQALASGRAAILGFTMPVWTVLIGALLFGERMTPRLWLATAATAGAVLLLLLHELAHIAGHPVGMAWMIAAALCWALGTLMLKRLPAGVPTEALTVWMIGLGVPVLWALALIFEPWPGVGYSPPVWACLVYGAAINYGAAQILWFSIARSVAPAASALSIMFIPVVGLGSALWITGERPYAADWLAVALIALSVAATLLPENIVRGLRKAAGRYSVAPGKIK